MEDKKTIKKIRRRVDSEYEGYPLIKYLKIIQPSWTKVFAIKMIRTKTVVINKERIPINYRLKTGDLIELYGSTSIPKKLNLSKLKPLSIVYEDEDLIIVDKELKISVQEDDKNFFNNMNNRLLNYLKWESNSWKPSFIHRLDYNTTGLLIGAKNYRSFNKLTRLLRENLIEKKYLVVVHGLVRFKNRTIKIRLVKKENRVFVVEKGGREAITEVSLVKHLFKESSSLLEVRLITGRTHQIRASLAHIGHPVRGDQKYGIEKDKKSYPYPALCAYKLKLLDKEFTKKQIWFLDNLSS